MAFNIQARVVLSGPDNLNSIINQVKTGIGSIKTSLNIELGANSINSINQLNQSLNTLNSTIQGTNANLSSLGQTSSQAASNIQPLIQAQTALQKATGSTGSAIKDLKDITFTASNTFSDFGEQIGYVIRRFSAYTVAAGAILGVAYAIKTGIGEAIKFQSEMVRLAQVSNDTASQIRKVEGEITRLSQAYGVSSKGLAESAVNIRQAGFSASETAKILETLAQAATSPNFDSLIRNAEGAIAVMNQFRITAEGLNTSFSSINAVAAEFAVSAKDIQDAIVRSGGVFSSLGGNLNEFIALFTSVKNTTQESSESIATGLRTIFARLQSRNTLDALEEMRINLRYTAQEARALGQIELTNQFIKPYQAIQRISTALRELPQSDPRYERIVEAIGGTRQLGRVLPLVQRDDIQRRALNVAEGGGQSLSRSAEQGLASLERQTTRVLEKFQEFYRVVLNSEGFQQLAKVVLSTADAIGTLLKQLGPAIPLLLSLGTIKIAQNVGTLATSIYNRAVGETPKRFAAGGYASGGPSVLTPGEIVVNPQAVQRIGTSNLNKLNDGGRTGWIVPGYGNTDSEYHNLEQGSFVIRKSSVQKVGAENLVKLAGGSQGPINLVGNLEYSKNPLSKSGFNRILLDRMGYGHLSEDVPSISPFVRNSLKLHKNKLISNNEDVRNYLDYNTKFLGDGIEAQVYSKSNNGALRFANIGDGFSKDYYENIYRPNIKGVLQPESALYLPNHELLVEHLPLIDIANNHKRFNIDNRDSARKHLQSLLKSQGYKHNDLHYGNFGFLKGEPIITDPGGIDKLSDGTSSPIELPKNPITNKEIDRLYSHLATSPTASGAYGQLILDQLVKEKTINYVPSGTPFAGSGLTSLVFGSQQQGEVLRLQPFLNRRPFSLKDLPESLRRIMPELAKHKKLNINGLIDEPFDKDVFSYNRPNISPILQANASLLIGDAQSEKGRTLIEKLPFVPSYADLGLTKKFKDENRQNKFLDRLISFGYSSGDAHEGNIGPYKGFDTLIDVGGLRKEFKGDDEESQSHISSVLGSFKDLRKLAGFAGGGKVNKSGFFGNLFGGLKNFGSKALDYIDNGPTYEDLEGGLDSFLKPYGGQLFGNLVNTGNDLSERGLGFLGQLGQHALYQTALSYTKPKRLKFADGGFGKNFDSLYRKKSKKQSSGFFGNIFSGLKGFSSNILESLDNGPTYEDLEGGIDNFLKPYGGELFGNIVNKTNDFAEGIPGFLGQLGHHALYQLGLNFNRPKKLKFVDGSNEPIKLAPSLQNADILSFYKKVVKHAASVVKDRGDSDPRIDISDASNTDQLSSFGRSYRSSIGAANKALSNLGLDTHLFETDFTDNSIHSYFELGRKNEPKLFGKNTQLLETKIREAILYAGKIGNVGGEQLLSGKLEEISNLSLPLTDVQLIKNRNRSEDVLNHVLGLLGENQDKDSIIGSVQEKFGLAESTARKYLGKAKNIPVAKLIDDNDYSLDPEDTKLFPRAKNLVRGGGRRRNLGYPDVNPNTFAFGGDVRDTVPAMLTPGEYVVQPEAVSRIGVANLDVLNKTGRTDHIRGYAKGGYVKGYALGDKIDFGPDVTGNDKFKITAEDIEDFFAKYSKSSGIPLDTLIDKIKVQQKIEKGPKSNNPLGGSAPGAFRGSKTSADIVLSAEKITSKRQLESVLAEELGHAADFDLGGRKGLFSHQDEDLSKLLTGFRPLRGEGPGNPRYKQTSYKHQVEEVFADLFREQLLSGQEGFDTKNSRFAGPKSGKQKEFQEQLAKVNDLIKRKRGSQLIPGANRDENPPEYSPLSQAFPHPVPTKAPADPQDTFRLNELFGQNSFGPGSGDNGIPPFPFARNPSRFSFEDFGGIIAGQSGQSFPQPFDPRVASGRSFPQDLGNGGRPPLLLPDYSQRRALPNYAPSTGLPVKYEEPFDFSSLPATPEDAQKYIQRKGFSFIQSSDYGQEIGPENTYKFDDIAQEPVIISPGGTRQKGSFPNSRYGNTNGVGSFGGGNKPPKIPGTYGFEDGYNDDGSFGGFGYRKSDSAPQDLGRGYNPYAGFKRKDSFTEEEEFDIINKQRVARQQKQKTDDFIKGRQPPNPNFSGDVDFSQQNYSGYSKQIDALLKKQIDNKHKELSEEDKKILLEQQQTKVRATITQLEQKKLEYARASRETKGFDDRLSRGDSLTEEERKRYADAANDKTKAADDILHLKKQLKGRVEGGEVVSIGGEGTGAGVYGRFAGLGSRLEQLQSRFANYGTALAITSSIASQQAINLAGSPDEVARANGSGGGAYIAGKALSQATTYATLGASAGAALGPFGIAGGALIGAGAGALVGGATGYGAAKTELGNAKLDFSIERSTNAFNYLIQSIDKLTNRLNESQVTEALRLNADITRSANTRYLGNQGNAYASAFGVDIFSSLTENSPYNRSIGSAIGEGVLRAKLATARYIPDFLTGGDAGQSLTESRRVLSQLETPYSRDIRLQTINRDNPQVVQGARRVLDSVTDDLLNSGVDKKDIPARLLTDRRLSTRDRETGLSPLQVLANAQGITGQGTERRFLESEVQRNNIEARNRQQILAGNLDDTTPIQYGFKRFTDSLFHSADALEGFNKGVQQFSNLLSGGTQLPTYSAPIGALSRPLDNANYNSAVTRATSGLSSQITNASLFLGRIASAGPNALSDTLTQQREPGLQGIPELRERLGQRLGVRENTIEYRLLTNIAREVDSLSKTDPSLATNPVKRDEAFANAISKYNSHIIELAKEQERIFNAQIQVQQQILTLYLQRVELSGRIGDIESEDLRGAAQQRSIRETGSADNYQRFVTNAQANLGTTNRINAVGELSGINSNTSLNQIGNILRQTIEGIQEGQGLGLNNASDPIIKLNKELTSVVGVLQIYSNRLQQVNQYTLEQLNASNAERSNRIGAQRTFLTAGNEERVNILQGQAIYQYLRGLGTQENQQTGFNQLSDQARSSFYRYTDLFQNTRQGGGQTLGQYANRLTQGSIEGGIVDDLNNEQQTLQTALAANTEAALAANQLLLQANQNQSANIQATALDNNRIALTNLTEAINQLKDSIENPTRQNTQGGTAGFANYFTNSSIRPAMPVTIDPNSQVGRRENGGFNIAELLRIPGSIVSPFINSGPGSDSPDQPSRLSQFINNTPGFFDPRPMLRGLGFATGGPVYASNGIFTPRGTDTVPAMLTPNEFVINAASSIANRPLIEKINNAKGKINFTDLASEPNLFVPDVLGQGISGIGGSIGRLGRTIPRYPDYSAAAFANGGPVYLQYGGLPPNISDFQLDRGVRVNPFAPPDGILPGPGPFARPNFGIQPRPINPFDPANLEVGDRGIENAFRAIDNIRERENQQRRLDANILGRRGLANPFSPAAFQTALNESNNGYTAALLYQQGATNNLLRRQLLTQGPTTNLFSGIGSFSQAGQSQRAQGADVLSLQAQQNRNYLTSQPFLRPEQQLLRYLGGRDRGTYSFNRPETFRNVGQQLRNPRQVRPDHVFEDEAINNRRFFQANNLINPPAPFAPGGMFEGGRLRGFADGGEVSYLQNGGLPDRNPAILGLRMGYGFLGGYNPALYPRRSQGGYGLFSGYNPALAPRYNPAFNGWNDYTRRRDVFSERSGNFALPAIERVVENNEGYRDRMNALRVQNGLAPNAFAPVVQPAAETPEQYQARMNALRVQNGLAPRGFATGGYVDGPDGGDVIPAMLSRGEFVMNSRATQNIGVNNLSQMQRFAEGGPVGGGGTGAFDVQAQAALNNFSQNNAELISALSNFSRQNTELVDALKSFPHTISMEGNHRHEVIINGAEAISQLEESFRNMVTTQIEESLENFVKERLPQLA